MSKTSPVIKSTILLFDLNKKSKRGYMFRTEPIKKFLASSSCLKTIADKTALGTTTHFYRKAHESAVIQKGMPLSDIMLFKRHATHYTENLYIRDNKLYADIVYLDPDKFEGETREIILFVRGLVSTGCKLSTSAGLEAYYNPVTKEGDIIYSYAGVDFTTSPDFVESQIVSTTIDGELI